jgi:hypothetical protein
LQKTFQEVRIVLRFVLGFFAAGILWGQSPQATVSGVISDQQGAVIPNVEVTATDIATVVKNAARTYVSGYFSLRELPIWG